MDSLLEWRVKSVYGTLTISLTLLTLLHNTCCVNQNTLDRPVQTDILYTRRAGIQTDILYTRRAGIQTDILYTRQAGTDR